MIIPDPAAFEQRRDRQRQRLGPARGTSRSSAGPPKALLFTGGGIVGLLLVGTILFFALRGGDRTEDSTASTESTPESASDPSPPSTAPTAPGSRPAAPSSSDTRRLLDEQFFSPGAKPTDSDTPTPTSTPSGPDAAPEPAVPKIALDSRQAATYGPAGCPVMVAGDTVWEIPAMKPRCQLQGEYESRSLRALSPDGRLFVAGDKSKGLSGAEFTIWDTQSGQSRGTISGNASRTVERLILTTNHAFLGFRSQEQLSIYNAQTGSPDRVIDLPQRSFDAGRVAVTKDGFHVVTTDDTDRSNTKLALLKIASGETVVTMRSPKTMAQRPVDLPPGMVLVDRGGWIVDDAGPPGAAAQKAFGSIEALRFSADDSELACIATQPRPRLICWSRDGKRLVDEPLLTTNRSYHEESLRWFPSGNAWLVGDDIFDRDSGRIVYSVRRRLGTATPLAVLDDDHLIGTFPDDPDSVTVTEIPWDDIRASLAKMQAKAPARFGPGNKVSLTFELSGLRGGQSDTVKILADAMKRRLEREEVEVEKGRETVVRLKLSESAGETLPVREGSSARGPGSGMTGRTVTEAKGSLTIELVVSAAGEPVWSHTLSAVSSRSIRGDVTNASVRVTMLQSLARQFDGLAFPYFIPRSDDALALPVVVEAE